MNDFGKDLMKRSLKFGKRCLRLGDYLGERTAARRVIVNQVVRSGTSIGANIHEAEYAQSRADFISKLSIALKEAAETQYWFELLREVEYVTKAQYDSLRKDVDALMSLLVLSVKKTKENGE